jgi:selenocysteine-specific elongation factor
VESHAKRVRRFKEAVLEGLKTRDKGSIEDSIYALLDAKAGPAGMDLKAIVTASELPRDDVASSLETLRQEGRAAVVGDGEGRSFYSSAGWSGLQKNAAAAVQDYHKRYPARLGMPKVELASRLKLGKQSPLILAKIAEQGALIDEGLSIRLPEHEVKLSPQQKASVDAFLRSLTENPFSPPSDKVPEPDLLALLIDKGQVVKAGDVVFSTEAYNKMVRSVVDYIKSHGKVTLAEVRDLLKTSRRYVQSLLEYMDEKKITRRVGDDRVLY